MFRANVYGLEPLSGHTKEEVHTGIEMVAAHIGDIVVTRQCRLKVSTDFLGHVKPEKIGTKKLDKMVELHVMAVPLSLEQAERIGMANVGKGIAFVDTSPLRSKSKGNITATTAHEVAHAIGFVRENSSQVDPHSETHCFDPKCIMHKLLIEERIDDFPEHNLFKRGIKAVVSSMLAPVEPRWGAQFDFCTDCKSDMHQHGQRQLNELRSHRLIHGI